MMQNLKIHQAKRNDLDLIQDILKETALWLKSTGSTQWGDILEGRDNHNVPLAIERGEVYYATVADHPAGIFILWASQSEWDAALWGKETQSNWIYLHRLAIRREYAGSELSQEMIDAAKKIVLKRDMKGIRLDCMADKEYLNRLYSQSGFTFVKKVEDWDTGDEKADFNLYQFSVNQ